MARYTRTLITALAAVFPDDEWRVLLPEGRPNPPIAGIHLVSVRLPSRVLYGLAGVSGHPQLDKLLGGVDVFWAPAPAPLALSPDVPFVLSLHDLSWEMRPSDFTNYERLWHRIARPRTLAARATRVIAVSDVTRDQAIEQWTLDPQKVITVKPGVRAVEHKSSNDEIATVRRAYALPPRYFLYVGALEPRKAPDVLARAFLKARSAGLDADLVIVGEGRLATDVSGAGVHVLGHVADAQLDHLYAGAMACVMPSRLEGFGLPPLEAALRGIPSIVSDLRVFSETLGDASIRVPVNDVAALTRALCDVAADPTLRNRLAASARNMACHFTPERAATDLRAVFADAVRQ